MVYDADGNQKINPGYTAVGVPAVTASAAADAESPARSSRGHHLRGTFNSRTDFVSLSRRFGLATPEFAPSSDLRKPDFQLKC